VGLEVKRKKKIRTEGNPQKEDKEKGEKDHHKGGKSEKRGEKTFYP